jgi:hypothetical protein
MARCITEATRYSVEVIVLVLARRANIETPSAFEDVANDIEEAEEGRVLTRAHLVRERSQKLREAKKAASKLWKAGLRGVWVRLQGHLWNAGRRFD